MVLVKEGEAVAGMKIVSRGIQQEVHELKPEETTFDHIPLIVIVLLALIFILVVVFRRRRK